METEHKTAIDKLSEQLNKIFNYFPYIKELLRWESFLKNIGLPDDMVRRLFNWFKQKQKEFLNLIGINPKEKREVKI